MHNIIFKYSYAPPQAWIGLWPKTKAWKYIMRETNRGMKMFKFMIPTEIPCKSFMGSLAVVLQV